MSLVEEKKALDSRSDNDTERLKRLQSMAASIYADLESGRIEEAEAVRQLDKLSRAPVDRWSVWFHWD